MPRLDSSAITKVTYNKKTKKMNVRFAGSGKNYTYINVPEDVYNDFINADSAGRFFNDYVKNDFEFTASPDDFVDSVRFNEQIMKLGAMTLSEQQFNDDNLVDIGDGTSISGAYLASKVKPRPITYYRSGDKIYMDPPATKPITRTIQGINYFGVGDGPDPNNPDPSIGVYAPSNRPDKNPLDRLKPTRTVPVSFPIPKPRPITESPVNLVMTGLKGLKSILDKAGPLRPYNYDYYQAIKRRNANRLNRGQY